MASYNRIILMGNLTRDIEVRYTPGGTAVTDMGLAVNNRIKRGEEWVDEPTFIDVTLWGRNAEVANEYLSKGSPVLVEGTLRYETWEADGHKRSKHKVNADKMQLIGGRGDGGGGGGGQRNNASAGASSGGGSGYGDTPF